MSAFAKGGAGKSKTGSAFGGNVKPDMTVANVPRKVQKSGFNLGTLLATAGPIVGAALGGPVGASIGGMAGDAVGGAMGSDGGMEIGGFDIGKTIGGAMGGGGDLGTASSIAGKGKGKDKKDEPYKGTPLNLVGTGGKQSRRYGKAQAEGNPGSMYSMPGTTKKIREEQGRAAMMAGDLWPDIFG